MSFHIAEFAGFGEVGTATVDLTPELTDFYQQRLQEQSGSLYLIAAQERQIAGHVLVTPQSKYAEVRLKLGLFSEVNGLAVDAGYQRLGVATALLQGALSRARARGDAQLGLAVESHNLPAISLYQSLAFCRHTDLTIIDEWQWTGENGVVHQHRDPCEYWTRPTTP